MKLFQNIPAHIFDSLQTHCDSKTKSLYFPLKDVDGIVVGYKRLLKENKILTEQTIPDANCFGLLVSNVTTKSLRGGDSTTAVIVSNSNDFLSLCTQKLNCMKNEGQPFIWMKKLLIIFDFQFKSFVFRMVQNHCHKSVCPAWNTIRS